MKLKNKKIFRIGIGLGIIIDKAFLEKNNLGEGDIIDLDIEKSTITTFSIECPNCHEIIQSVPEHADEADCPHCGMNITHSDFKILDIEENN